MILRVCPSFCDRQSGSFYYSLKSPNHTMKMEGLSTVTENESIQNQTYINKDDFCNWLMNGVACQSTMISRAYGENIIQFLRDQR